MSKASEWAKRYAETKAARPDALTNVRNDPKNGSGEYVGAGVTDDGQGWITSGSQTIWLSPSAFLAIAQWANDTFGPDPGGAAHEE